MRLLLAAAAAAIITPAYAQTIATNPEQPGQADTAVISAGTYVVDPAHTQVGWAVNHMGFSVLEGMFGASGGSITIDPANPEAASVEVEFQIGALSVTFPPFGEHLQSPDFFDVANYPTARFVSTAVTIGDANTATITGDLTIKDQTHPVTIEASFIGAGINPMDQKLNFGFEGTTTIARSDFGVGAYAPGVSDEVLIDINAAFMAP